MTDKLFPELLKQKMTEQEVLRLSVFKIHTEVCNDYKRFSCLERAEGEQFLSFDSACKRFFELREIETNVLKDSYPPFIGLQFSVWTIMRGWEPLPDVLVCLRGEQLVKVEGA